MAEIKKLGISAYVFIHDLIAIHHPQLVSHSISSEFETYLDVSSDVKMLLTSTEYNKRQIESYFNFVSDVRVVGLGVELPTTLEKKNPEKVRAGKKFVLMVSTLEPRKGHKFVIDAFEKINEAHSGSEATKLILVGNKYGNDSSVYDFVQRELSKKDWLEYLGVVSDQKLQSLIDECEFMIYGSTVEGYGLPILESISKGKVVLFPKSDCYEHFEGLRGCINYIDGNTDDLVSKLNTALEGKVELHTQFGFDLHVEYTWPKVAERILSHLEIGESKAIRLPTQMASTEFWPYWPLQKKLKRNYRHFILRKIDAFATRIHASYLNGKVRTLFVLLPEHHRFRLYRFMSRVYRKLKSMISS
jgi:glycosyltransferase involved in cell wall biosynthesis